MKHAYEIVYSDQEGLTSVSQYSMGHYDLTTLWQGKPLARKPTRSVKLIVENPQSQSDYVSNAASWPIFSKRFLDIVLPLAHRDIEVLPAPLFISDGSPWPGYFLVNCIRRVRCLHKTKSVLIRQGKHIRGVIKYVLKAKELPEQVHIFRIDEFPFGLFLSQKLRARLKGSGLTGLCLFRWPAI